MDIASTNVLLIPIDNRPVTYLFPQMLAAVAGLKLVVPKRELMGSLTAPTNIDALSLWLSSCLKSKGSNSLFVCIDSLIYGGLIASRRGHDSIDVIKKRIKEIANWKNDGRLNSIYAQSSIMRISDNYDNVEEKEYWSRYGREIFQWSELLHKQKTGVPVIQNEIALLEAKIDSETQADYLKTRERNFQVNQALLEYAQNKEIDFLIFSQDDSGQYGLNVYEKEQLLALCKKSNIRNVIAYPGADEVLMTLLARWLTNESKNKPKVSLCFNLEQGKSIYSNFEGQTIGESLLAQINAAGLEIVKQEQEQNLTVIVHTSGSIQGDHVWLPGHPDHRNLDTQQAVAQTIQLLEQACVPCLLCDVAYANGADPMLINKLMVRKDLWRKIWAYGGWNTTGNTVGSVLAMGVSKLYATQNNSDTELAFKKAMFVRLIDDWAYQTQVRKELKGTPSIDKLNKLMAPFIQKVKALLEFDPGPVNLTFPWQRTFEVEVGIEM